MIAFKIQFRKPSVLIFDVNLPVLFGQSLAKSSNRMSFSTLILAAWILKMCDLPCVYECGRRREERKSRGKEERRGKERGKRERGGGWKRERREEGGGRREGKRKRKREGRGKERGRERGRGKKTGGKE